MKTNTHPLEENIVAPVYDEKVFHMGTHFDRSRGLKKLKEQILALNTSFDNEHLCVKIVEGLQDTMVIASYRIFWRSSSYPYAHLKNTLDDKIVFWCGVTSAMINITANGLDISYRTREHTGNMPLRPEEKWQAPFTDEFLQQLGTKLDTEARACNAGFQHAGHY